MPAIAAEGDQGLDERVRDHFDRGQSLYEEKKFEAAAAEFRAAYEIKPAAAFIFNEAVCYERLDNYARARSLFQRYLAESPRAKDRKEVEERIAALTASQSKPKEEKPAPKPEPQKLQGVVFIESKPSGATVYLDDRNQPPLGETPWNGALEGPHRVIIVSQGYRDEKKDIVGKPGTITQLYIALSQEEYLSWLEVRANLPGADVYLDSKESGAVGRTPYLGNVTPGKHTLFVSRPGFTEYRADLQMVAGEPKLIQVTLEPRQVGFVQVEGGNLDGAAVELDGRKVCTGPCRFEAARGDHRVSVSKEGRKSVSHRVAVGQATETLLDVKLAPEPSRTDAYVKLVVGAVIVGGGFFVSSQSDNWTTDTSFRKVIKYGGYVVAGAGAIAMISGVVGLLQERGAPSTASATSRDLREGALRIEPLIGPGEAGVVAVMRF